MTADLATLSGLDFPTPSEPPAPRASAAPVPVTVEAPSPSRAPATTTTTTTEEHSESSTIPGWTLIPLSVLLLIAGAAAFALSFAMIVPVVEAAGWDGSAAWLGPVMIDIAAVAAALMGSVSRNKTFQRTGMALLVASTALSILMNLAGHQLKAKPEQVQQAVLAELAAVVFSVAVPTVLAALIHVWGRGVTTYLAERSAPVEQASWTVVAAEEPPLAEVVERASARVVPMPSREERAARVEPKPAPQPAPKSEPAARPAAPPAAPRPDGRPVLDQDTAVAWATDNGTPSAGQVRDHFAQLGYDVPTVRSVRRWLSAVTD